MRHWDVTLPVRIRSISESITKKLYIITVTITKMHGMSTQDCCEMACRLCASRKRVSQLTAGGYIPNPKKLRAVSTIIIPGIAKVSETRI